MRPIRNATMWVWTAVLAASVAVGVAAQETEGPPVTGWSIEIDGYRSDELTYDRVVEAREHPSHVVERELERKGEVRSYRGMPFRLVVAMADGPDDEHPYAFNRPQWEQGYEITLVAADGYAVTFDTSEVDADALVLADTRDGEAIAPRIVGDVSSKLWVKDLSRIELNVGDGAVAQAPDFTLTLVANGETVELGPEELEASPHYTEGAGQFTTSAGSVRRNRYAGVRFADLLSEYIQLEQDTPVTVVAADGYEMTYPAEILMDESDGTWILAFRVDGEYMPFDPGPIRTVKVGPDSPDIPGHLSVKMVSEVRVSGEPYREFSLEISGKTTYVVDRHTFQSGVNCHRRTVTYRSKRSGEETEYTGIPIWRLLAYADDPDYAPHAQDDSIRSYVDAAAMEGYIVRIEAADGFAIELESDELHLNDDVIIAMYREGETLPDEDWPLIVVWDTNAEVVPSGIKAVRNITSMTLVFGEE